jgi:cation diffusion facilitator family transporter
LASRNLFLGEGIRITKISIVVMVGLTVLKGVTGFISGSIALLADSLHSFSDVFVSIAVFAGLKIIQRKPTEMFRYGFYKAETLVSLLISVIIIFTGVNIALESFKRFFSPQPITYTSTALLVAAISAIVSYVMAYYKERTGRRINSQALIGDGKHSRIDSYASTAVFVGIALTQIGVFQAESLAGLAVSIFVVWMGLGLGKDSTLILMDACTRPDLALKIAELARKTPGVLGVHEIKLRRSGPLIFGEMHLEVSEELSVNAAHQITEEIESKIIREIGEVEALTIHVEPTRKDVYIIALPVEENKGLNSPITEHFGKTPLFLLVEISKEKIRSFTVEKNPFSRL